MRNRLIYIAANPSSFVNQDIAILSRHFEVTTNIYQWYRKPMVPILMLRQLFFILFRLRSTKAIFISTAGYWSVIPAIFGKCARIPVFIILNGTDCASIPSLGYGSLRKPILREMCRTSMLYASSLLPVSDSLVRIENTFYPGDHPSEHHQGFLHHFPDMETPSRTVSNALDATKWQPIEKIARDDKAFVAVFATYQFRLKGGDLILGIADRFPDCTFFLAGCDKPSHLSREYPNVRFLGRVRPEALKELYSMSRYVFQLSAFEGFGMALCEAMLCECVPIVSSSNILPEIIGESGYVLDSRDPDGLAELIRTVLASGDADERGKLARQRISSRYTIELREKAFLELL